MLSGDCESPIISGVIVNPNIILQTVLVSTFCLGIVGAVVGDLHLCALGLVTAFGCVMMLIGRDDK